MQTYADYEGLAIHRRGHVLVAEIVHGEGGTTSLATHRDLSRFFADVNLDEDARVVVLTGQGSQFTGGALASRLIQRAESRNYAAWRRIAMGEGKKIITDLLRCEKPIIARINGDAIGFGSNLALLCDFPFILADGKIGDTHVNFGLTAGDGGSIIWPMLIGFTKARHYLMTGDLMTGREAERIGLVAGTAETIEELDQKVYAYAERLAGQSPVALSTTKVAINMTLRRLMEGMIETTLGLETIALLTDDHLEACRALRDEREPEFRGD